MTRGAIIHLGCAVLSGCVEVMPNGVMGAQYPVRHPVAERDHCPMPPIPQVVHITIEPGKPVVADAGGEALLRAYVKARAKQ